ncbi:MAG: chromosomal replication initiator DnaA [Amylibacter sp.]|nr:chromosomal replication initiator DnaA [Amylibacter sp.]
MSEQMIFDLPPKTAFGREDFFVSPSNDMAVRQMEGWQNWPLGKLVLCGPKGSGKSHLVHIWAEDAGAIVLSARALAYERLETLAQQPVAVEDVHLLAQNDDGEAALFHLHNLMNEAGHPLLMTGVGTTGTWDIKLPDLASRLSGSQLATMAPPDDALLSVLLVKLFWDRQITVEPPLISYIVKRMDRSFASAGDLVRALDRASLKGQKPITTRLAGRVMAEME